MKERPTEKDRAAEDLPLWRRGQTDGTAERKPAAKKRGAKLRNVAVNCILVAMLAGLSVFSLTGGSTGLAFSPKENQPYYKGNTTRGEIALMVNVYWGTEFLDSMLTTLKQYDAKVTFFLGGSWADDNNDLIKRMLDEGHELGNHGYFHRDHKKLSLEKNAEEIRTANELVKAMTGYEIKLFAPPSGSYGKQTLEAAAGLNMKVIMWSKDTVDWRDKDSDLVYSRATNKAEAGDMILMHPTAHTAQALPRILRTYREKGLRAVTVSQIISAETI